MAPAGIVSLTYGGQEMNDDIKRQVWKQIADRGHWYVRNDTMGGDPQPGVSKTAVVDFIYEDGKPVQRQYCGENGRYDFAWQIESIWYGGKLIEDPEVYWRFTKASFENGQIEVNNSNLGCDPQPGQLKHCSVRTRYREKNNIWEGSERYGNSKVFEMDDVPEGEMIILDGLKAGEKRDQEEMARQADYV